MAEQPIIVVRGEAEREVPPEIAVFTVTVLARDKDREVALIRLTERADEVLTALDDFTDAIERRETSGVHLSPQIKRGSERVVAYTGSVGTTVWVTDFAELGTMLLRLADREQTQVAGPWWELRRTSRARAQVRRDAIAEALNRAHEYADAVGARVDKLLEISDEGAGGGGMMRMALAGGAVDDSSPELVIEPQQQTVHASVIVRVTITEPRLPDYEG
ncbi:SIMPL domain-containing protein [Actinoplanes sp. N902-109]|uniref:SIMPL domain-containing protein n=1 Tax=Actinoplanes sp. (strain N902-109) TaxID=649831 RepID=UPI0003295F8F|nr:SIMPL domain-containing protein [Actinoplanes sp. N902-109]AGL20865.1 hypothetical protein L083_7355 [Actinoplanes sp. N902-109]